MQIIRLLHFFKQLIYAIRKDHRFLLPYQGQIAVFACKTLTIHLNKPACYLPPDKACGFHIFQLCSKSSGVNPFTDALRSVFPRNYASCVGIPCAVSARNVYPIVRIPR